MKNKKSSSSPLWKNPLVMIAGVLVLAFIGSKFLSPQKPTPNSQPTRRYDNLQDPNEATDTYEKMRREYNEMDENPREDSEQLEDSNNMTWYTCQNMQTRLLKPAGWYTKEESQDGTQACFITKERITSSSGFTTGLSINAVTDVAKKTGVPAKQYARDLIYAYDDLKTEGQLTDVGAVKPMGNGNPFAGYAREASLNNHHFYYLNMVNTQTDTLYIISFEGVDPTWDQDWTNFGTEILSKIGLNPEL